MAEQKTNTTFLAIISCLLWSSAFAGIKIGLQYTTPLQFAGIRFFISGLLVLPVAIRRNPDFLVVIGRNWKTILLIGLLQTFIQYALFYTGIEKVPGAIGAIVIGSSPLFIAMIAHQFMPDEKLTFGKFFSILFGILGVVLISLSRNRFGVPGKMVLLGILILVGNNIISGFTNVLIAREKGQIPPFILSAFSLLIGGLMLLIVSIPVEGLTWNNKPLPYFISLSWLSILSAVAISIWTMLLKRKNVRVSDLNFWKFLIPVSGAILSWILLPSESPDIISVSGMFIIAFSLIILNLNKHNAINKIKNQ